MQKPLPKQTLDVLAAIATRKTIEFEPVKIAKPSIIDALSNSPSPPQSPQKNIEDTIPEQKLEASTIVFPPIDKKSYWLGTWDVK